MKKVLLSLAAALGFAGMAFAGDGTQANPFTVDDVIEWGKANNPTKDTGLDGIYVKGYIVGYMPENNTYLTNTIFSADGAVETNLVLGESSSETDNKYCIGIQLPNGNVRKGLNLKSNPNNLRHEVILHGDIRTYCGATGIKNTDSYEWVGEAPIPGGGNTGGNTDNDDAYLTSGLEPFTIENVTLPEALDYVWAWDSQYGAKASAFLNQTNYAAEAYLISPELTLSADTKSATFSQALNYLNGNNRADYVNVVVREGNGAWQTVNVSAWPAGKDWGFVDDCEIDLSAYAGKTIQIAFRYTSSSSCAPTWEVKRLRIGTTATGGDTPSNPTDVWSVAEALTQIAGGFTGTAQVKGYITSIEEVSTSYGNATYNISDDTSASNVLKVYRGYYLNGDKFTSESQIKVGDIVVVEGTLKMFYETPEVDTGSKIISINGQTSGGNDNPGENPNPNQPTGESVTFDFTAPASLGINVGDATEYDLTGVTLESGIVTMLCEGEGASTPIRLYSSNGNWTFRFYNNTSFTVSVPEAYLLTGIEFNGTNLTNGSITYSNGGISGSTWTPSTTTNTLTVAKTATSNNPTVKTMKVYYADAAGVDEVLAADDSEAVYFNLQGVKVANPERGIYIKVVGNKAVKVVK